ncbi:MAG: PTS sugar transporter subunit IIA [Pseudomonadota bacterium]
MKLIQHLCLDSLACNVQAGSKKHAMELLSQLMAKCDPSCGSEEIFSALVERERIGCTAMKGGIAMPHARLPNIEKPIGALIQLQEAVDFDAPDDEAVDLVFGLVVPADMPESEANGFSNLMQRLRDPDLQKKLREADTAQELLDAIAEGQDLSPEEIGPETQNEAMASSQA